MELHKLYRPLTAAPFAGNHGYREFPPCQALAPYIRCFWGMGQWTGLLYLQQNVYLEQDGTLFLLFRRSDFEAMTDQKFGYAEGVNGHYEIAVCVENYEAVDRTYAEIVEKGAVPVMAPVTEPWGQRTCYVADPEGNLVEIGSFVK